MPDTDIRWRDVYAWVKKLESGLIEFLVEIRWEGSLFGYRLVVNPSFYNDLISYRDILDEMVDKINEELEKRGHPPYTIRSE